MRAITPAEAEDWRAYMSANGLGDNTIRRHVGRARQLFKGAIRRGLVRGMNPFDGMAATVRADKARLFFVTREMAAGVLGACPDAEWKLLFALSRYGGLRCPSEHLALKWSDVDWERNRMRVPSPKTEHHQGKESRVIPLFPELRVHLLQVFDELSPGASTSSAATAVVRATFVRSSVGSSARRVWRYGRSLGTTCDQHGRRNWPNDIQFTWSVSGSVTAEPLPKSTTSK
jgi:integrase